MNLNFHGIEESTVDLNDRIVCGRGRIIRPLRLNVDWSIGIELTINEKKFYIINVYLPYEKPDNESHFIITSSTTAATYRVAAVVDELDSSCVYIIGDMNADIGDDRSTFANHLQHFCVENGFVLSSQMRLPQDSYKYHTTSWLDHCFSSEDAQATIQKVDIKYKYGTTDHISRLTLRAYQK